MDVTLVGLQNAGKTSLLRVLSVSISQNDGAGGFAGLMELVNPQGGEFAIE